MLTAFSRIVRLSQLPKENGAEESCDWVATYKIWQEERLRGNGPLIGKWMKAMGRLDVEI